MGEIILVEGIKIPIGSHESKKIIIGSDHRGFDHKNKIIKALQLKDYQLTDVGTFSPERCDYPEISKEVARIVCLDLDYNTVGIGICGSGIGILIPASKYKGIYVARCLSPLEAETSRKHNNSNFLGIGADYIDLETAIKTIEAWLKTPFYSDSIKEKPYLDRYVQTVKLEKAIMQENIDSK